FTLSAHCRVLRSFPTRRSSDLGACIVLLPVALVLLQPDTGSALAFFALVFVFYREGYISGTWMLFGGLAILLFVLALVLNQWVVDRKRTRLNSSHVKISYAVFC